ncbi:hypothetical protein BC827DRAFT_1339725 [Russula dissimulans]|nr:hypothetical protein BC827DRAFT_1339725 [Russula dissimulans]
MTLNIDMFPLVGFGCEAFLHGCYTFLFVVSIYLMVKRSRNQNGVNKPIFVISIFLYLSCFAHFILEFIHYYTTLATADVEGFANETHELMAADLLISVTDFIGELILIYRCWLLWDRKNWIIMFPSLCAITGLACVCAIPALLLRIDPNSDSAPPAIVPLGMAGLFLPLVANMVVTILITMRIWQLSPHNTGDFSVPSGITWAAIGVVVESGMLYLVAQIAFVVLFTIQHPAQDIAEVVAVQIYGIAPALIIIRVALGLSNTSSGSSRTAAGSTSRSLPTQVHIGFSTSAFSESGPCYPHSKEIPMSPIRSKPSGGVVGLGSSFGSVEVANIA